MIAVLARAARHARKASTGDRVVEIVLTEEGWIIRGSAKARGREVRSDLELGLCEFEQRPDLLINSVNLVDRALARAEAQASS